MPCAPTTGIHEYEGHKKKPDVIKMASYESTDSHGEEEMSYSDWDQKTNHYSKQRNLYSKSNMALDTPSSGDGTSESYTPPRKAYQAAQLLDGDEDMEPRSQILFRDDEPNRTRKARRDDGSESRNKPRRKGGDDESRRHKRRANGSDDDSDDGSDHRLHVAR